MGDYATFEHDESTDKSLACVCEMKVKVTIT